MFGGPRKSVHRLVAVWAVLTGLLSFSPVVPSSSPVLAAGSRDPAFQTLLGSQAFGEGLTSTGINSAVQLGSYIYFGGSFTRINGDSTKKYLAKYDPATDTVTAVDEWQGNAAVTSLATNGTLLFVGGSFTNHRSVATADYLAKYDPSGASGSKWAPILRTGAAQILPSSGAMTVNSLVYSSSNSTLYVGGFWATISGVTNSANLFAVTSLATSSSTVTGIASASCLTPGIQQMVMSTSSASVHPNSLYVAGYCSRIAYTGALGSTSTPIPYVARLTLSTNQWDAISSTVLAFTNANSNTTTGLKYSSYHVAYPRAIAVDEDSGTVYVGGYFSYYGLASTDAGRTTFNGLMKASADSASRTTWSQVTTGSSVGLYNSTVNTSSYVHGLTWVDNDGVYVGGQFTKLGGATPASQSSTAETDIRYLARIPSTGGSAGQIVAAGGGLAGTAWLNSTVKGMIGPVSVTKSGSSANYFIPFGFFTNAGNVAVNDAAGLMATDASSWSAFAAAAPLNNDVYAVAVTADNRYVYVGGDFTSLGGVANANYLAVYDRTTESWSVPTWWYSSATTSRFKVRALKISGSYIYVAGISETSKGQYVYRASANAPAAVSPTTPTAVSGTYITASSGGTTHVINAIEFDASGRLVVGGSFTKLNETACPTASIGTIKNLFRVVLAGTEACEVIGGVSPVSDSGKVNTIVSGFVDGASLLFVGGEFQNIDSDTTLDNVAVWDDSGGSAGTGDWLGLGSVSGDGPVQNPVYALALNGSSLYVGGSFSDAGGVSAADALAAVNLSSNSWSSLGTTPGGTVRALAQIGSTLYVGGSFDGTDTLPTTRGLIQIALASAGASPSTSVATKVGRTGGSITGGAIYTMAKKRIGSGDTADNFIYIGGTFTDLGQDATGDRIGLVHPTVNDISLSGSIADVGMDASPITLVAEADSGLTVTATNSTPSRCTWAANQITLLSIGTCTILFDQAGGGGFAAATQQTVTFEILKGSDSISFPQLADRSYSPSAFDPSISAASSRNPSVQVAAGSSSVCRMVSGAVEMLSAGACELTASLGDSTDWNAAEDVTRSFTVSQASQTISFTQPGEQEVGTNLVLAATSSSSLSVSYSSASTGICSVSSSTVTFLTGGDCEIVAAQSGNTQYQAASNVSRTFKVWPTSRYDLAWNTWEFPSNSLTVGAEVTVRALAQQLGNAGVTTEVEWASSTPSVCTVSSTLGNGRRTVTPVSPGSCVLSLSRSSDSSYRALSARIASMTVEAAPTTTTPPPTTTTEPPSTTVVATVAPTTTAATSSQSALTINNTYVLPKSGKAGFKPVTVPLKPTVRGEVISKISSSPRTVCNAGNFGTSKKPVWKVVMSKPGRCAIKMTLKTPAGKYYNSSTTIIVR